MKSLVTALAFLLLAVPASGDLWVEGCTVANVNCLAANDPYNCCTGAATGNCPITQTTGQVGGTNVSWNKRMCWTFLDADAVDLNSPTFNVTAQTALVCYDHDLSALTAPVALTDAEVDVFVCPDGGRPGAPAVPEDACMSTGGAPTFTTLTGLEGNADVQNACKRIPGGSLYYLKNVSVNCPVGKVCRVSVQGETPQP